MSLQMSDSDSRVVAQHGPKILGPSDPSPVVFLNDGGAGLFVLGCEHAGNAVPEMLETLGLTEAERERHIAWDIGGQALTRDISGRLDCPAIMQRYSRLVYDCNRTVDHPGAFVVEADGSQVVGNKLLSDTDKAAREREIYRPFHDQLTNLIERRRAQQTRFAYVAIHSFNEAVRGQKRPWHIGFIYNQHAAMSKHLIRWFETNTDYVVGDNAPYSPIDAVDHTVRVQAEVRGIPYSMIEVRNDLLRDEAGIGHWADLIARALQDFADTQLVQTRD